MTKTEGPRFSKRKRLGKNKKKSWRAIDISATEEVLEEERVQLRTFGLASDKADSHLFQVERIGIEPAKDKKDIKDKGQELKCYSVLKNSSLIAPPRKNYPKDPNFEEKVLQRELRSLRNINKRTLSGDRKTSCVSEASDKPVLDIWGTTTSDSKQNSQDDFFTEVTKKKRVQRPKHIKRKNSLRKAVIIPHPGASVNPSYDDHQELLHQALIVEVEREKKQQRIFNALDAKFPAATEAPSQATWLNEMSGGLFEQEQPASEEEAGDDWRVSLNPPADRQKKKTRKDRRKQKEARILEKELSRKKQTKERENKVYSLAKIRSELAEKKRAEQKKAVIKANEREQKKFLPKKIGKFRAEEPEIDVKLSTELTGSLRTMKPEGHLLEDHYKSMMLRNVIEPRAKAHKKKPKTKKFEKKSFREVKA